MDDPPAVIVVVELAGVDPADVDLAVVEAGPGRPRAPRAPARDQRIYQHMEIDYGSFERRVQLNEEVDAEAASATYESGLLVDDLPLARRHPSPCA